MELFGFKISQVYLRSENGERELSIHEEDGIYVATPVVPAEDDDDEDVFGEETEHLTIQEAIGAYRGWLDAVDEDA